MRQGTTVCPFCSEAPGPAPAPRAPQRLSRETLTRSAILFAGAALLQAGCGGAPSRSEATPETTSVQASDEATPTDSDDQAATPGVTAPVATSPATTPEPEEPAPIDSTDRPTGTISGGLPATPMPRRRPSTGPRDEDSAEGFDGDQGQTAPMYGTPN